MAQPWIIGPSLETTFEYADNFLRMRAGRAVRLPVLPGLQVHERLGEQHRGERAVGVLRVQVSQGIGVGPVQRRAVFGCGRGVAEFRRRNQLPLERCGAIGQEFGQPQGLLGLGDLVRGNQHVVDVRSPGVGDAPVRHGETRVVLERLLKASHGFFVVEAVAHRQTPVEPPLGVR